MTDYKVVILTAGHGLRLGKRTEFFNKCLLRIGNKAAITHIIDKYPVETEFVVVLGYHGDMIRQYLSLAHQDRKFVFIEVDKISGEGSGPGYSLKKCKDELRCPFFFWSCDTLVEENLSDYPIDRNWVGSSWLESLDEIKNYCTIELDLTSIYPIVTGFRDKTYLGTQEAFIGLAFIKDYEDFWKVLESNNAITNGEVQIIPALACLKDLWGYTFTWFDIGNEDGFKKARDNFKGFQNLDKSSEEIYFFDNFVLKYFYDDKIVGDRIERSKSLDGMIPKILGRTKNFYKSEFLPSKNLFEVDAQDELLESLLNYTKVNLWKDITLDYNAGKIFKEVCRNFYYTKTYHRLQKLNIPDAEELINRTLVGRVQFMVSNLDWDYLCCGIPSNFHGDYTFSNILLVENQDLGSFKFVDWRENFGSLADYGDRYYDLAKLYHCLLFPHNSVKAGKYCISKRNGNIDLSIEIPDSIKRCHVAYDKWLVKELYDLKKVKILTALILLNMSPLHESPLDEFLYYYGKWYLGEVINDRV